MATIKMTELLPMKVCPFTLNNCLYQSALSLSDVKVSGCTSIFSTIFTKGNNFYDFLFALLDNKAHLKWGLLLKKKIAPTGAIFFLLRVNPI